MKLMKWWGLAMAALLALTSVGCSTEATPENEDPEPITLEIVGDDVIMLGFNESRSISVRALFKDRQPVIDRKISFLITGAANGATLSAQEVITSDTGVAETTIKAGDTKAQFFVKASSSNASEVQFAVDVNGKDIGSLRVYYGVPEKVSVNFSKLSTRIHPEPLFDCASFNDWADLPEAAALQESRSTGIPVLFADLKEGSRYTITVVAYGPEGNEIAHGCKQSSAIIGRKVIDESVDLTMLPTSFTGTYQMATTLNLTSMIPGGDNWVDADGKVSPAYIVKQVLLFFEDPGDMVLTNIERILKEKINPTLVDVGLGAASGFIGTFCQSHDGDLETDPDANSDTKMFYFDKRPANSNKTTRYSCWCATHTGCGGETNTCGPEGNESCKNWAQPELAQFLDLLITGYAPAWVGNIFEAGTSISSMIQKLVVGGEFEITKATQDATNPKNYTLEGVERWNSYMFTWTMGKNCSPDDSCCGETVFGAGNALNNKLEAASGTFVGQAKVQTITGQSAYELTIEPHPISLDYGKIIIFLLENLAFPAMTKLTAPVTFTDVLTKLIPVNNVGCWINSLIDNGLTYEKCLETCQITLVSGSGWQATNCGQYTQYVLQGLKATGDLVDSKVSALGTSGTDKYKFELRTNDNKSEENYIVDTNQDLQADHLSLNLVGSIYLGDNESNATAMTGSMVADFARVIDPANTMDRTSCHSDKQCVDALGEGRSCQIREGLVSKCAARMVCALNVGSYVAGAACKTDEDCQSGFCMKDSKTCYSACSADNGNSDCSAASAPVCSKDIPYTFKNDNINTKVSGCKAN